MGVDGLVRCRNEIYVFLFFYASRNILSSLKEGKEELPKCLLSLINLSY